MPTRGWGILYTSLESSIVSVQALSCPTLWSNELQYIRLTCPSPSTGVCSNSCPLNQGCYLISHPLPPFSPSASVFPSITVFSNELALHIRWSKYWSFSSNEYSGLTSLKIDLFDLLTVQGTLKSLLQHHNSKAWILQHSAFFMVQLSHLYMTPGKTIALTIWTFVSKVMSLLLNILGKSGNSDRFYFLAIQNHCGQWLQQWNEKTLAPWKKSYDKPRQCIWVSSFV